MDDNFLLGLWRYMLPVPRVVWRRQVAQNARRTGAALEFMSQAHHRVRDFVVRELPRAGEPLSPDVIAQRLNMTVDEVNRVLDDLEQHKTFVFRNEAGAVAWAYPVTTDRTPHLVKFSTGEQIFAA